MNRQVKKGTRVDKRSFIHDLTEEAETAAGKRDKKRLYEITRTLSGKNKAPSKPVKDKNGEAIKTTGQHRFTILPLIVPSYYYSCGLRKLSEAKRSNEIVT